MARLIRFFLPLLFLIALPCYSFGQIPKPTDAPKPISPEESVKKIRLPDGYRMELVAAEPLVREPSGVCWDEKGRMFVCELHGYNLEGQYDIEELNKTGLLDRVVRRIQAEEKHKRAAEENTFGVIRLLRDKDGDGRADESVVWADRLPPCLGICPARGGLIVACHAQVLFLADRDGDDKAEVREVLFEGFAKGPLERSVNCPQWGPDNWIYLGRGAGGGTIRGLRLEKPVNLPGTDFRIRPDGSAIEPVPGATHTMGFAFTPGGDRFVISTRQPAINTAPFPWKYQVRNPYVPIPSLESDGGATPEVYPISPPHPWRSRRADDPGFSKYYRDRYGLQESAPNGYFTSACSPMVYQDSALPGLNGQLLACEPAQNLVFRSLVEREGLRHKLRRIDSEKKSEFLASIDPWFHAISLVHAPDGSIFLTDFYREIIEDYSAIPRYLQQIYGLVNGQNHGRVWRLTHAKAAQAPSSNDMSRLDETALVAELTSERHWRRETAQRLLVEKQARNAAKGIRQLLDSKESPMVLRALHTLAGLGVLTLQDVLTAFDHGGPEVKRQALRYAEPWLDKEPGLLSKILAEVDNPEQLVRFQVALTLGESKHNSILDGLARLAIRDGSDPWMASAILSSSPENPATLVERIFALQNNSPLTQARTIILGLASSCGASQKPDNISGLLRLAARAIQEKKQPLALPLLDGLATGLKKGNPQPLNHPPGLEALQALLMESGEIQEKALQLAGILKVGETAGMNAAWQAASANAGEKKHSREKRLAAINLLAAAPYSHVLSLLRLLNPAEPLELQLAAIRAISAAGGSTIADDLTPLFPSLSPQAQAEVMEALCARQDRLEKLFEKMEAGSLSPGDLPPLRKAQLLEHPKEQVRERAKKIFTLSPSPDKRKLLAQYASALKGPRDTAIGKTVFEKQCIQCHQLGRKGATVGPDLDSVRNRPEDSLLPDILDPSATINPKFRAYMVEDQIGRVFTGVLASESATSITLKLQKDESITLLRANIEEMRASTKSLMPDGIEKIISPGEMASLLAYLRESLGPPTTNNQLLFDEEGVFPSLLNQGDARATLSVERPFKGKYSLEISGGQRHSNAIKGWQFPIVENPGPGQFRYLRLAWKTTGEGVMIELADKGQWPPADKPLRRYYSGKNLSAWKATQVAMQPPREWSIVTLDLWKDFGAFTLTGIAPTAMGATASFDAIELLSRID